MSSLREPLCLGAALCAALVAACDPHTEGQADRLRYLLTFDITQSMNVQDMRGEHEQVSRLRAAKNASLSLVEQLPCGTELGIAVFTEHRTLLLLSPVELCEHYDELKLAIEDIDWTMAWRSRSEVAKGLDSAIRLNRTLDPPMRLVFFTDGHEAPPIHPDFPPRIAARPGEALGVVVGVGGDQPMPIPKLDAAGEIRGVWRHDEVLQVDTLSLGRSGNLPGERMAGVPATDVMQRIEIGTEHLSSLREDYLRRLAARVRLDYLSLDDGAQLAGVLRESRYALPQAARIPIHRWLGVAAMVALLYMCLWTAVETGTQRGNR